MCGRDAASKCPRTTRAEADRIGAGPIRPHRALPQIGALGGQITILTYGRRYMTELGRVGLTIYVERYHNGNRAAALGRIRAFRDPDACGHQPEPLRQLKQHAA